MARDWLKKPITLARELVDGPVVRNAGSLYGSTIVTSILGFFYWFTAARLVPAKAVGTASAIQSAALFLGFVCVFGLGTLLISELSADRSHARSLILTAATLVGAFSLVVSGFAGVVLGTLSPALRLGLNSPGKLLIFALLGTFTTVLLVLDDACIGLMRGDLQLRRNTVFAVSKLLLLPILILIWNEPSGSELVVAWLAGLVMSLWTLGMALRTLTKGQSSRLNPKRFIEKRRLVVGHHSLNLSIQSPRLIIPVVVTIIIGPQANAAFTAAMLVVSFVNIIPYHLSTVLFALTPGDEAKLHREVHRTMRICLYLSLVSAPFFALFSGIILGLFGPFYKTATVALIILGLTTYPEAIKCHYVAIARVRGQMQQASFRSMVGAILEVGLAAVGCTVYGLTGVALGFLSALLLEALLFSPTVFRLLRNEPV